jgi:hypothetical protein
VRLLEDPSLPLMVFGPLSFLRHGRDIDVGGGLRVPVPRTAGLLLEKLVTDRSGTKGDRDLLVALGLLLVADDGDLDELVATFRTLSGEIRHSIRNNLTLLSLLDPIAHMPDPIAHRARVAAVLARLDLVGEP